MKDCPVSLSLRCTVLLVCSVVSSTHVDIQSSQGTQGLSHAADAYRGPETGTASKPTSLSSTHELKVQAAPTRLRLRISAPSAPSWHCTAPTEGWRRRWLPQKCGLWQQPHARPGTLDRLRRGPQFHVVCLCRESLNRAVGTHYTTQHAPDVSPSTSSAHSSITSSTAAVSERRQAPCTPERVHMIADGRPGG